MIFLKKTSRRPSTCTQPLQDCNPSLCILDKAWIARNAKVLCQNAIGHCRNDDPVHSIERSSRKVPNGAVVPPFFYRRTDYAL